MVDQIKQSSEKAGLDQDKPNNLIENESKYFFIRCQTELTYFCFVVWHRIKKHFFRDGASKKPENGKRFEHWKFETPVYCGEGGKPHRFVLR